VSAAFLLLRKNPPYDVLTFGPLGNYSHTGTGPKWQSYGWRGSLTFTYYVSTLFLTVFRGTVYNAIL
jgi:hypothetical protein